MATTNDPTEQIGITAKVSSRMWQTIVGLALASGGAIGGVALTGAKSPPAAVVAAPDPAPELRASIATVASSAAETKRDGEKTRAELAGTLTTIATVQAEQAKVLSDLRSAVARIEGRLDATVARRR